MQRAEFLMSSVLTLTRLKRFDVSAEDLAEGNAGLAAYEALGDPLKIGWSYLSLASLYQNADLAEAEAHTRTALALGASTGDTLLQMRSLVLLALICRRRGNVEEVKRATVRAQSLAEALHQPLSIGTNKANMAFLALREGKLREAQVLGEEALAQWRVHYSYLQWLALLPLLAIALAQDRLAEAIAYARALLAPDQQILTPLLTTTLEAALDVWDATQPDAAQAALQKAIVVAREAGYL